MAQSGTDFFEQDRSLSGQSTNLARYMFTIRSRKGALGATEIRNYDKLKTTFGLPIVGIDDHLAIKTALDGGAICLVSRVVHFSDLEDMETCAATFAEITVGDGIGAAAPARLTSASGPFTGANGNTGTIDVDGAATVITLTGAAAVLNSVDPGGGATGWNLGGTNLHVKVKDNTGAIIPYEVVFSDVGVADPDNYTQLEAAAQINLAVGGQHATKSGNFLRMTADIKGTRSYLEVPLGGAGTANVILGFSTTPVSGTGVVPNIENFNAAETVSWITGLAIAGITLNVNAVDSTKFDIVTTATGATVHLGWDAGLLPPKFGFTNGPGGDDTGTDADAATDTVTFTAESRSGLYNGLTFTVSDNTDDANKFDIAVPLQAQVESAEKHIMLDLDPESSRYVVTVLNSDSKVLRALNLESAKPAPFNNPAPGTYVLTGGADGTSGIVPADFLGHQKTGTGVHGFDNVENAQDIFVPGLNQRATVIDIGTYAEARGDMNYIFTDFPKPNDVDDMIAYRNGTAPYNGQGAKFNNSHLFLYGGRPKELDFTGQLRPVYGSGHIAKAYAFNDTGGGKLITGYGVWYAPAGTKRTLVKSKGLDVLNVGAKALKTDRAALEEAQINMFADFGSGVQLHDERSTQISPTMLRDIHVRRFLNMMKRLSIAAVRIEEWDPLDPSFFKAVVGHLEQVWTPFTAPSVRALANFRILGDQEVDQIEDVQVNNLSDLQQGIYRCYIFLKPFASARTIQLIGVVTGTEANFNELVI